MAKSNENIDLGRQRPRFRQLGHRAEQAPGLKSVLRLAPALRDVVLRRTAETEQCGP